VGRELSGAAAGSAASGRGWGMGVGLRARLTRLERQAGVDDGGRRYAVVCHDRAGGVRRLLASGPADWRWGDLPPDTPPDGLAVAKRLGPGLDWGDL
jgi:hypothetical protein